MFSLFSYFTLCSDWGTIHRGVTLAFGQKKALVRFVITLLFFALPGVAQAQTPATLPSALILDPTYQEIILEESDAAKETEITLSNLTQTTQLFELTALRVNQIDAQGNVILSDKPLNAQEGNQVDFVQVSSPQLELKAGEKKELNVTIQNTQDLSPGGHYVALVVVSKTDLKKEGQQTVLPALSTYLLIRKKGGEQFHLSLKSIQDLRSFFWSSLPTSLTLEFENQGNVHNTPRGQVKLKDLFGRTVVEGTVNDGSLVVLPQSLRNIPVRLRQIRPSFPIMIYTLDIQGSAQLGEITYSQSRQAVLINWKVLVLSLMVGAVVSAVLINTGPKLIRKIKNVKNNS